MPVTWPRMSLPRRSPDPVTTSLPVLYDAGGVLAVAKPAGLPTQAPTGIESAESCVRHRLFGDAASRGGRHPGGFLGVPHRLDRPVSGVLLFATTPRAARQLSRQFERRRVTKTYVALLDASAGAVDDRFEWRDFVRKVPDAARAEIVSGENAGGREAVTTGRVIAVHDGVVRVELVPATGRMHQLRVQAASRRMPVLGDVVYGGPPGVTDAGEDPRLLPIALHASRIAFEDPVTGLPVEVDCPPPTGWIGRFAVPRTPA